MTRQSWRSDLTGWLLVATPSMTDPAFRRSVILVCKHGTRGAVGLVLNRPATDMTLGRLFRENDIAPVPDGIAQPVHAGGPANIQQTFVLHDAADSGDAAEAGAAAGITLTPRIEMAERLLARSSKPRCFIALGHCAWDSGDLEGELVRGLWLAKRTQSDLVFDIPVEERWQVAMNRMQVDPGSLSAMAGHA
jgi:putative transcriptional regulator